MPDDSSRAVRRRGAGSAAEAALPDDGLAARDEEAA
jgi:hypothetical protein